MRIRQAVILCGGLGSRLKELTAITPKPLLSVGGRTFLEILIEEIARQGPSEFLLLAAFEPEQIRAFADKLPSRLGRDIRINVVVEPERAGTGGALLNAAPYLDDIFYLFNGDSWFDEPIADLNSLLASQSDALGAMALRRLTDVGRFGTVRLDGNRVSAFVAKTELGGSGLVNSGIYLFRKEIIDHLPTNGSLEQETLTRLASAQRLVGFAAEGYFIDIGIPEDYARAQTEIPAQRRRPAVFFDRDGVLNRDHSHVGTINRFEWITGAREAVRRANRAGYYVFVVTNQAGIAKGFYSEADYREVMAHMTSELLDIGAHVDDVRYCPYHPDGSVAAYRRISDWRKPAPGMLHDLMRHWPVDLNTSFLIGDKASDLQAAASAGIRGYLFDKGDLDAFLATCMSCRTNTATA